MKTPTAISGLGSGQRRKGFGLLADLMGPRLVLSGGSAEPAAVAAAPSTRIARLTELKPRYDPLPGLMICDFSADLPILTGRLLDDMAAAQAHAAASHKANGEPVHYLAWASKRGGAWNLGGDLNAIAGLVRSEDRAGLARYAAAVAAVGYRNHRALDQPLVTVALVRGKALGLGFEAALSANVIIAERGARFGMPEALFNLVPGVGAYSYLARRINPGLAERMTMGGALYGAAELYEMGVVDILCEEGGAVEALYGFMGRNESRRGVQRAIYDARRRINPISQSELDAAAVAWVEAALALSAKDLRVMARIAASQMSRERA